MKSSYFVRLTVWVVGIAIAALFGGILVMNLVENLHELGFLHRTLGYWDSTGIAFSLTVIYYIISMPTRLGDDD